MSDRKIVTKFWSVEELQALGGMIKSVTFTDGTTIFFDNGEPYAKVPKPQADSRSKTE